MPWPDPLTLARFQYSRDVRVTQREPSLLERKRQRMATSPLAYLRGAAPLFYELLAKSPELAAGPEGEGWIIGDMHLENFGAFKVHLLDKGGKDRGSATVFHINDFDEAVLGPLRVDVLRLVTSLLLGGRELGAGGVEALSLCHRLLEGYVEAAWGGALGKPPRVVKHLLDSVDKRSGAALLKQRAERHHGKLRFERGERYRDLPEKLRKAAVEAFARYVDKLPADEREGASFEPVDLAFRVAGTGSLGSLRIAVLVEGKGGHDGAWIFDMKEQGSPSAELLLGEVKPRGARRVESAMKACLPFHVRRVGRTKLDDRSMLVRRLTPQEDRLALERLAHDDLPELAAYLGGLLGQAHHLGKSSLPAKPWSKKERAALIERAIIIAGVHEAAYLSHCHQMV